MIQLDIYASPDPLKTGGALANASELASVISMVLTVAGIAAICVVLVLALRHFLTRRRSAARAFRMTVLKVRVPKETKKGKDESESTQHLHEMVSVMETVFATLGSLPAEGGVGAWFRGRSDLFSFEIVFHDSLIHFYVAVPEERRNFVEEQIHAQFPDAEIDLVADYNLFSPTGVILGSFVKLRRESAFPIRTYQKSETDPLNSLTNALAKLQETEGGAVQFVVRSAPRSWRSVGLRIARNMQQGKKLQEARGGLAAGVGKDLRGFVTPQKKDAKPEESYRLSPLEEEMVKGLEEKASKAGLETNIRVLVSSKTPQGAQRALNDILGAFGQYSIYEYGNAFVKAMPRFRTKIIQQFIYRSYDPRYGITLNAEELASLYHFPLPVTQTPKIDWLLSRKALPPSNLPEEGIVLGYSEYRGHRHIIRMKQEDRRRHTYIIGKSGSGKTELMKSLVKQDIESGRGVCVIDPHGDFAEDVLGFVPRERAEDVIYFNPGDTERPMGLNMLEYDPAYPEQKTFVINEMLKIFDKLYDMKATGGPMFEQYMRNAMQLVMDDPESGSTLMEIPKVLSDEDFRRHKLSKCKTPVVRDFWIKEAQKAGGEASLQNMVPYITSKLTPFITNDVMRPIIGQQKSAFNVRQAMDEGKILLLNLSKGKLGELNAYLIGMVLVGKILMASLSRADAERSTRKDFYLYIDEFQNFLTDSITSILSEARKYALDLIIAHQFIGQLTEKGGDTTIRDAIFGNVGTMAAFRVGAEDAEFLSKEFDPVFGEYDLVNAEAFTCNIKLLIDNTASRPFNMHPIAPDAPVNTDLPEMIKELSRYKYGRKRELVEAEILERQMSAE